LEDVIRTNWSNRQDRSRSSSARKLKFTLVTEPSPQTERRLFPRDRYARPFASWSKMPENPLPKVANISRTPWEIALDAVDYLTAVQGSDSAGYRKLAPIAWEKRGTHRHGFLNNNQSTVIDKWIAADSLQLSRSQRNTDAKPCPGDFLSEIDDFQRFYLRKIFPWYTWICESFYLNGCCGQNLVGRKRS
jgi:hypothetical protein